MGVTAPTPWPPSGYPLGPPPPPLAPRYRETQHIVHAIVAFFTFGLWIPFWIIVAITTSNRNARVQMAYEQSYAAWQQSYWRWQHGQGG